MANVSPTCRLSCQYGNPKPRPRKKQCSPSISNFLQFHYFCRCRNERSGSPQRSHLKRGIIQKRESSTDTTTFDISQAGGTYSEPQEDMSPSLTGIEEAVQTSPSRAAQAS